MYQRSLEQNHQRLELEKWEQQLHEREMHIVELELSLLMAKNNQERVHNQTPKIQKRSGRFMRSLLNGNTNLSSNTNTLISSPTSKTSQNKKQFSQIIFFCLDFRHLISVCHNHPGLDHTSSPTIPTSSSSPISCPIPPNSSNMSPYNRSYSSSSTPSTPNMSRLRTLTCTYIHHSSSFSLIIDEVRNNYILLASGDLIINKRNNDESLSIHDGKKQQTQSISLQLTTSLRNQILMLIDHRLKHINILLIGYIS
jgi:hypothetical protein